MSDVAIQEQCEPLTANAAPVYSTVGPFYLEAGGCSAESVPLANGNRQWTHSAGAHSLAATLRRGAWKPSRSCALVTLLAATLTLAIATVVPLPGHSTRNRTTTVPSRVTILAGLPSTKDCTSDDCKIEVDDICHTTVEGESCLKHVKWVLETGIPKHPEWYPDLSTSSSIEEVQAAIHKEPKSPCPRPCLDGEDAEVKQKESAAPTKSTAEEKAPIAEAERSEGEGDKTSGKSNDAGAEGSKTKENQTEATCRTAVKGELCFDRINWVLRNGIKQDPDYYEGLSEESEFEDVQAFVHEENMTLCPEPCPPDEPGCPACAPREPVIPDVVIPFFERDLCKLKYTAKSFGANDPNHLLGDVFLMWVSSHPVSDFQSDLDEIQNSIRSSHQVHFMDFQPAMQAAGISGWFAQQVLKLKIASQVRSNYYIVLDAKNTLIREVKPNTFFSACNQGNIQAEYRHDKIPMPHSDWYRRSADALGLQSPSSGYWPASVTPVVMHKQTVLDMLGSLGESPDPNNLCGGPLCDKLGARSQSGHGATEFTLYTLYAYEKADLSCIHSVDKMQNFEVGYTDNWLDILDQKLASIGLVSEDDEAQLTVSSQDGWPLAWSPGSTAAVPSADKFPLKFEDLTHKWATSLWRGVPENQQLLEAVNLQTLNDMVNGVRQFPLMFGAQPASLSSMGPEARQEAVQKFGHIYQDAKLYDPSEFPADQLVDCVVGWKN